MNTEAKTVQEMQAEIRDHKSRLMVVGPRAAAILLANIDILKRMIAVKENVNVLYGKFGGKK